MTGRSLYEIAPQHRNGQLSVALLPLEHALPARLNVDLPALTASTIAFLDRLLTLIGGNCAESAPAFVIYVDR